MATLNVARAKVREAVSNGMKGPVTVSIRGGEYELDATVGIEPIDLSNVGSDRAKGGVGKVDGDLK